MVLYLKCKNSTIDKLGFKCEWCTGSPWSNRSNKDQNIYQLVI